MTKSPEQSEQAELETAPPISGLKIFAQVFFGRKLVVFGAVIIVAVIFTAIFAPSLAPYHPYELNLGQSLAQPSREHLLGTDIYGRDTLSRIIYGTRTSLLVGIVAIGISASIGMTMGLAAGYFGGIVYMIIMRLIDALMAVPLILKALIIAALLGGGLQNIIIAIGIGLVPVYARMMCAQVIAVKQNDYITAARAMGARDIRIMFRHIVPNSFPPIIVLLTIEMGVAILAEAGLSFLGLGIDPPGAAWGSMVKDGYKYIASYPVLSISPGFAIMLTVFAFNMVGDGLRDALDPRLRGIL